MSFKHNRTKCRCCNVFFTPDPHNPGRQFYCWAPACRRASKAASQRRWLRKPANRTYFRDAANVQRVQQWRKANPGYWKRSKSRFKQDQPIESQPLTPTTTSCNAKSYPEVALQDFVLTEHPAFVGLVSMVTGSTLQEDIAHTARNLLLRGQNILGLEIPGATNMTTPPTHEKASAPTRSSSPGPGRI